MTYIPVKLAADLAGRNERTVRRWIKTGRVKYTEIKGKYHVEEESLGKIIGNKFKINDKKIKIKQGEDVSESRMQNTEYSQKDDKKHQILNNQQYINPVTEGKSLSQNKQEENGQAVGGQKVSGHSEIMSKKMSADLVEHFSNAANERTKRYIMMSGIEQKYPVTQSESGRFFSPKKHNLSLQEGVEYEIPYDPKKMSGHSEIMSEYDKNNMSANIFHKYPYISNSNVSKTVEMSDLSTFSVSDSLKRSGLDVITDSRLGQMSKFFGHLPTNSDMSVDNFFDSRGTINAETPFFSDKVLKSKKMSENPDIFFGHSKRIFEMSAYATRLIEEKERVAKKFEEQNDWLKGEISELRKEISALRGAMTQESQNRVKLTDFLIERNLRMENRSEKFADNQSKTDKISPLESGEEYRMQNPEYGREVPLGHLMGHIPESRNKEEGAYIKNIWPADPIGRFILLMSVGLIVLSVTGLICLTMIYLMQTI